MEQFERFRFSVPAVPLQKGFYVLQYSLAMKGRFWFRLWFLENGSAHESVQPIGRGSPVLFHLFCSSAINVDFAMRHEIYMWNGFGDFGVGTGGGGVCRDRGGGGL